MNRPVLSRFADAKLQRQEREAEALLPQHVTEVDDTPGIQALIAIMDKRDRQERPDMPGEKTPEAWNRLVAAHANLVFRSFRRDNSSTAQQAMELIREDDPQKAQQLAKEMVARYDAYLDLGAGITPDGPTSL